MRQRKLSIMLALCLIASAACTKSANTNPTASVDPLRNVAIQTARLSDAANAATKTTIALRQDNLINDAQEREVLLVIQKANDGARILTNRLKSVSVLDDAAKGSLLTVVNEISAALADQRTLSLFGVSNPKSRERISAAIDTIVVIISVLKSALGGK